MPFRRHHEGNDICAIFVHAGAGYHSVANEKLHLAAVNDAARVGMAILRNGGHATDAVEMAIRLLEDREITNAGYGSNLTIDGQVECDATMVDHLGRSGAVGAVSQIKNPIMLARVVLEASSRPLSLQRVPPNLIVGPGAVDFAANHGVPILPNDFLVSETARCRWMAWKQDLLEANERERDTTIHRAEVKKLLRAERGPIYRTTVHTTELSELPSPGLSDDSSISASRISPMRTTHVPSADLPVRPTQDDACLPVITDPTGDLSNYHTYARVTGWTNGHKDSSPPNPEYDAVGQVLSPAKRQRLDGSSDTDLSFDPPASDRSSDKHPTTWSSTEGDRISDTVGCIAVDQYGHIAAGSSSGGIGMKHRGRCGPAALVGIGTAVIPVDPEDPEQACVATVTSGTGEHMATTTAAATAADRIYLRIRRDGAKLRSCEEDEALDSMIRNDFMGHPGVRNQPCVGAIGILAVKKTKRGIYFYFSHNTDSFALASMHSEEAQPVCTMSRSKGSGSIASGGRLSRGRGVKS